MYFKTQKWHKPSKKQQRKHAPAPLNDITVKKPKSERVLQDTKENHYCRSLFDPRAPHHQKPMTVTERDLDILVESTNGNCGLVLLMRKHNQKPAPDLDMISHEETIETEVCFTYPSISQILNNFNQTFDKKLFMNKLSVRNEQMKYVESATRQQNSSSLWYKFRYGRIAASNFKEVICSFR